MDDRRWPSLALARAIVWRRLAGIRDRRPARREPEAVAGPAAGPGPRARGGSGGGNERRWLAPIVVDYFGRDGSTALLRLLASSPAVVVEGRYPYEASRLRACLAAAGLLGAGAGRGGPPDAAGAEGCWRRSCQALLAGAGGSEAPRFYAEKLLDARRLGGNPLPGMRTIVLLRDPRDTLVSIEAFSRAVGSAEIGGGGGDRDEMLRRYVRRQRQRLRWIAALPEDDRFLVVDYRTLVEDLEGLATRLGAWLGVGLEPAAVARDFRLRWVHGTSPRPERSIGRWRSELDPGTAGRLDCEIGPEMRALGFA